MGLTIYYPPSGCLMQSRLSLFSFPSPKKFGKPIARICLIAQGWMNGRIEGQSFINSSSIQFGVFHEGSGISFSCPFNWSKISHEYQPGSPPNQPALHQQLVRAPHCLCLWTWHWLSLSKGLITEKGIAGRITSVITELLLPDDSASFSQFNENCILCGKCIKNCPLGQSALKMVKTMISVPLSSILFLEDHSPWYGCGKCQVNVPCESKNPAQKNF